MRSTWRIEGSSGGANLVPQPGALPGIVAANGASPTGGRHRDRPAIEEYMAHRRAVRRCKLGATTGRETWCHQPAIEECAHSWQQMEPRGRERPAKWSRQTHNRRAANGRHRERPAIEEYMAHRRAVRRRKLGATTGCASRHRGSKWSLSGDYWLHRHKSPVRIFGLARHLSVHK